MQRILERGKIEAFAQRAIPRIRLPDRSTVFAERARRLRELSERGAIGHAIGPYIGLMAALCDAQQTALAQCEATLPSDEQLALARSHGMPLVVAAGRPRDAQWRDVLAQLCAAVAAQPSLPAGVHDVVDRLQRSQTEWLERQADALLSARVGDVEVAAAPFLSASLQVYWLDLANRLPIDAGSVPETLGVCPICGTLPVASIVRTDQRSEGFRYLHCALCATEWHLVRVTCSHCQRTSGISYQSIEGGNEAIRAECCEECRTYRKILYQEKDPGVEPVADDLASLALDLLLAEAGYHRPSANPLLWHSGNTR